MACLASLLIPLPKPPLTVCLVYTSPLCFVGPSQPSFKFDDSSWCAGLSESWSPELASFGIRVLQLVPGDMRTSFVSPANIATCLVPLSDAYKGTIADHVCQTVIDMHGKQPPDPRKAAEKIVEMTAGIRTAGEIVASRAVWLRIPIGTDSGEMMKERVKKFGDEVNVLEPIMGSCAVDG